MSRAPRPGTVVSLPQTPFLSLTTHAPVPPVLPPAAQLPAETHDTEER